VSGETVEFGFGNFGPCEGLTPGYWFNWKNHYTEAQFLTLLTGTIAEGDIDLATSYLDSIGCDGGDALHCMRRFLLADQLTINLASHPLLFNDSGGVLNGQCSLNGAPLQSAIDDALRCLAAAISESTVDDCSRDELLAIKTRLASFAEL
jgi:hypothetical protein